MKTKEVLASLAIRHFPDPDVFGSALPHAPGPQREIVILRNKLSVNSRADSLGESENVMRWALARSLDLDPELTKTQQAFDCLKRNSSRTGTQTRQDGKIHVRTLSNITNCPKTRLPP
jgi:hypothetical protein